jgi:glycosyltransferase involved in cell wall biosynthesis
MQFARRSALARAGSASVEAGQLVAAVQVVMPAYNAAEYIGDAIESVLAQTFTDWELVVVDDGSTDATPEVVSRYADERIRLLRIEHSGLPAARNRGLAESRSPFVAFLDADDLWREDKLERQLAVMEAQPDAGLVHTGLETLEGGERRPRPAPPTLFGPEPQFVRLAVENFIAVPSVLLRRTLLDLHGGFDEDPQLVEDFELWLRLAPHTTFAYIDEPLLVYRLTENSLSKGNHMGLAYVKTMEKMQRLYPDLSAELGTPYLRKLGHVRCFYGLSGRGRREFLAVIRSEPRDGTAWKLLLFSLLPTRAAQALADYDFSERLKLWVGRMLRRSSER